MKNSIFIFLLIGLVGFSKKTYSQCETWHHSSELDNLENAFVIYRDYLKKEELEKAYPHWEVVYQASPALDGKRSWVYSDGRILLTQRFNSEMDKKQKKEIAHFILRLIEEQKKCYPESEIVLPPKNIMKFRSEIK